MHSTVWIIFVIYVAPVSEARQYARVAEMKLLSVTRTIRSTAASSAVHCSALCSATDFCYSVSFNSGTRECVLSNQKRWDDSVQMEAASGWNIFRHSAFPIFHSNNHRGRQRLTFEEATNLCLSRNTEIATEKDMEEAEILGYSRCDCGWNSDQIARYVYNRRNVTADCERGLHVCPSVDTSDVYCKVNYHGEE